MVQRQFKKKRETQAIATFAILAYDCTQFPPFCFERASVIDSFMKLCFAKWSRCIFSNGTRSSSMRVAHTSESSAFWSYTCEEYIFMIDGNHSKIIYIDNKTDLFRMRVILLCRMLFKPSSHSMHYKHATRVVDLGRPHLIRQNAFSLMCRFLFVGNEGFTFHRLKVAYGMSNAKQR